MRIAVVGASAVVGLVFAAVAVAVGPGVVVAGRPVSAGASGDGLVTLATPAGEHRQQITVIDPHTRAMAVYHVDTTTGEIVLRSVRNIQFDLQMMEFNGTNPLPGEIRAILEQR